MTGHGAALVQDAEIRVLAEVRSVNNRFLKTHIHCDLNVSRQSQLEALIKQHVNRGSLNLKIKSERLQRNDHYHFNEPVIRAYWLQLSEIAGSSQHINVESLLHLPGVVAESIAEDDSDIWTAVEKTVIEALQNLNQMRAHEGAAMKSDLLQNCGEIRNHLEQIETLAPGVVENFSSRMTERIKALLEKHDISTSPAEVIREVGIFSERVDVSEETVRLNSHLIQFAEVCESAVSNGRKLDFLVQEMLRETNTIGSKANDSQIASRVIEIKTLIERIREMVQNVE
jgi:uncharacterized protein (TIGR00255 family)